MYLKTHFLHLPTPPSNLVQETLKDILLQALSFINLRDKTLNHLNRLLFVFLVVLINSKLHIQFLNNLLRGRILSAIVIVKNFTLLRGDDLEGFVDEPPTLVILDVSPDFTDVFWVTVAVKVVVLNLEILSEWDEDVASTGEVLGGRDPGLVHSQGNGEIE